MDVHTHTQINHALCGAPGELAPGVATAALTTSEAMAVDAEGLVHGGFVFGLADHAAMLAVNDPLVVLGAADVRFTAPVRVGDVVVAKASRQEVKGRKHVVRVVCTVGDVEVLSGSFTTFVLDQHVLAGRSA